GRRVLRRLLLLRIIGSGGRGGAAEQAAQGTVQLVKGLLPVGARGRRGVGRRRDRAGGGEEVGGGSVPRPRPHGDAIRLAMSARRKFQGVRHQGADRFLHFLVFGSAGA